MTDITLARRARHLRLDTLVRLRWLAVIGQSIAVTLVHFGIGLPLPFALCIAVIVASAGLNLILRIRYPLSHRLSDRAATALLAFDVVQLALLLYLTGGLQNPFAIMFLAPVMISATALPPFRTCLLGALVILCSSILALYSRPLPWLPGENLSLPLLYVTGIWVSILLGLAFISVYAWRVAEEARTLAEALTATELVLAREQHLSQLDGLAAAAAHELGTPLATIALVVRELQRAAPAEGSMQEDLTLLREQVERCRDILGQLTSLAAGDAGPLESMSLGHFIEDVAGPQRPVGVPIDVELTGQGPQPVCRRNPGKMYGVGNLVDNAVDFAKTRVSIAASWTESHVRIVIRDDGPGFAPEVLLRLGEPYVTTRGRGTSMAGDTPMGLGLGLFIAKTLLERSGATLSFANVAPPETGAIVTIEWPRLMFEWKGHGEQEQETATFLPA